MYVCVGRRATHGVRACAYVREYVCVSAVILDITSPKSTYVDLSIRDDIISERLSTTTTTTATATTTTTTTNTE